MGNLPCANRGSGKEPVIERLKYDLTPIFEKRLPIYWVTGPIFSGKTKQATLLSDCLKYTLIDLKELLGREANLETDRGRFIKDYMDKGFDIPNELAVDLIKEDILKHISTAQGFVIASFPRTIQEADLFVKELYKPQVIFLLNVKFPTIMDRVTSEDSDLTITTVQEKLNRFRNEAKNIRAVYDHKIEKIDGNESIDVVFSKIQSVLNERFGIDIQPSHIEGQN